MNREQRLCKLGKSLIESNSENLGNDLAQIIKFIMILNNDQQPGPIWVIYRDVIRPLCVIQYPHSVIHLFSKATKNPQPIRLRVFNLHYSFDNLKSIVITFPVISSTVRVIIVFDNLIKIRFTIPLNILG